MKWTKILIICGLLLSGCGHVKYIPTETKTVYNYVDSLVIRDSTVIIPIEKIVDIVPQYDTLKLSTSLAESVTYVDTSLHLLKGSIANKKGITEHIIYKDRIVKQIDSVYVEKPYPVEVEKKIIPKWTYYSLLFNILILIILIKKLFF